jgi:hypothetical protein
VIVPKLCYYGQYLDPANAVNPNCVDCPADKFCWYDGIILADITAEKTALASSVTRIVSGKCPSGFKCASGANIFGPNHLYATNSNHYLCREGYYCDNTLANVET